MLPTEQLKMMGLLSFCPKMGCYMVELESSLFSSGDFGVSLSILLSSEFRLLPQLLCVRKVLMFFSEVAETCVLLRSLAWLLLFDFRSATGLVVFY